MFHLPESNSRFGWTRHIKNKMVYYGISQAQIMRIFRLPQRREEGIAPGTIGAMRTRHVARSIKRVAQVNSNDTRYKLRDTRNREEEIWIMYKLNSKHVTRSVKHEKEQNDTRYKLHTTSRASRVTMISAWRYPGKTKPGERPPIPAEFIEELTQEGAI